MTDLTDIISGTEPDGSPASYAGDTAYASIIDLVSAFPDLLKPEAAAVLADHVNNFAQGMDFDPITDPAAFAEAYRAQLAQEDPSEPWQEDVFRLCDFGMPDLDAIRAPQQVDGALVFYVAQSSSGLPYRVTAPMKTLTEVTYEPVSMEPIDA